jgi:hypothetical protein
MPDWSASRRQFFALLALTFVPKAAFAAPLRALLPIVVGPVRHPTPRQGITAARVLTARQLDNKHAAKVFDLVRQIPEVVDGIHCYCGCASREGFYSLLSCYEEGGMAQHCETCQGEARLAYKLHSGGSSLDAIRTSIDASFADR